MRRVVTALLSVLVLSLSVAQIEVQGIVIGDALGWDIEEVTMLLSLGKDSPVKLEVYSPGFDPDDYRAALEGKEELGDERYDQRPLVGHFILEQDNTVFASGRYEVEAHRWETLYEGTLKAGGYFLRSSFIGNAKNAYIYRLSVPEPQTASLSFAEGTSLFDVRGHDWVKGFEVSLPREGVPSRYALYDGDGTTELEAKLIKGDGSEQVLEVSESLSWTVYEFTEPGNYQIFFRIPEGAYQYSNTVAFREIAPGPVTVEVVDTEGNSLDVPYDISGYSIRVTDLDVPPAYEFVGLEQQGGELMSGTQVKFGYEGGHVRYILKQNRAELRVESILVLPSSERPYALRFKLNDELKVLPEAGRASYGLPAGDYRFDTSFIPGAKIEGPESISLRDGDSKTVRFLVYPEVKLDLEVNPKRIPLGDTVTVTTTASTEFPDFLPADLSLILDSSWRINAPRRITRPISSERTAVVELIATPRETGVFPVVSNLDPWELRKQDEVQVIQPAKLNLEKIALHDEVAIGDTAEFSITVSNVGDVTAEELVLTDTLPLGLEGENLEETFSLNAGERRTFMVSGVVAANAPVNLVNEAVVNFNGARQTSSAAIRVLRPEPELSRSLSESIVLPGEVVTITLKVGNISQTDLNYTLTDMPPEWLTPLTEPRFEGELKAQESYEHSYEARVQFGPEAEAGFEANLKSNGGDLKALDRITRKLVPLEKLVSQDLIIEGETVAFSLRITNPLARPIELDLRESPDTGLNLEAPASTLLTLEANESRELSFPATPVHTGELVNEAVAFANNTPVSFPVTAEVLVRPLLEPERISDISLPFIVDASRGERLLIRHEIPEGSRYELGSSRLGSEPVVDPLYRHVKEEGGRERTFLYWQLPYREGGNLHYTLRHREELGALEEASLTLGIEARELYLQGEASFEELKEAQNFAVTSREGLIKEPLPGTVFRTVDQTKIIIEAPGETPVSASLNGQVVEERYLGKLTYNRSNNTQRLEYFGLPLDLGENVLSVSAGGQSDQVSFFRAAQPTHLSIVGDVIEADGVTPIEFKIRAEDNAGLSSGFGAVSIDTELEPLDEDAFPDISGHQILMQEGEARLRLRPVTSAQRVSIGAKFNNLEAFEESYIGGIDHLLYTYQGSLSANYDFSDGQLRVRGLARGYIETPIAKGSLQVALDTEGGIAPQTEDYERFPLTGSGNDAQSALESDDFVAARYDDSTFSVGYYSSSISLPGLDLPAQLTALQGEARLSPRLNTRFTSNVYIALAPESQITETIVPDGTRLYFLQEATEGVKEGSETLTVLRGSKRLELQRLRDYSINYLTGTILLTEPLYGSDLAFPGEPVRLEVSYTRLNTPRTLWTYGGGVRYQLGFWEFGASIAQFSGLNMGAFASYNSPGMSFQLRYSYTPEIFSQFGLDAAISQNAISANLNVSYNTELLGQARVAYAFNAASAVALEHSASSLRNQSNALYEHTFDPFTLGLGLAYLWEDQNLSALARAGYDNERFSVSLTHSQPFSGNTQSLSDMRLSYRIDQNLSFDGSLDYLWGNRLGGSIGLVQTFGQSNFAVSYQLPATDGTGNLARFGIDSPWQLAEHWFLDTSAAYEQNFNDGSNSLQAGLGVRYQTEYFNASFASEFSYKNDPEAPFKLVFRTGASGQLDHQQVLSFDANYQVLPEQQGDFTIAYALRGRDLSLLSYHTLTTGEGANLTGEIAPTLHIDNTWQLRPAFIYKLPFETPMGNTYLFSLGGHYYIVDRRFGVGAAVHHEIQPGTASSATALSLEGSANLVDNLWLVGGYTLSGFEGLSQITKNGLFVRLELFGGSQ